jgi:hypothetical protein
VGVQTLLMLLVIALFEHRARPAHGTER